MKTLTSLSVLTTLAALAAFGAAVHAETPCEKVSTEAKKLPAPNPVAVHDYLNRVVDQGIACVKSATDPAPSEAEEPAPSPAPEPQAPPEPEPSAAPDSE